MSKINLTEMYVDDEIKQAALDVLDSGRYIKGPRVKEFEEKFAHFTDAQFGVATSSGTTALLTVYMAMGLKRNDEVIVPSHTFIATATPFLFLRAKPVFVDIDPETYTMNTDQLKEKITIHTKIIVPVHIYGHPANMQPIMEIAQEHRIKVIEDSCQAHGAIYQNQKVGDIGDAAVFSYFPSKNMTVAGDGGMVVTNNVELADKMRLLRNHGRTDPATSEFLGLNFRMSELHAAIGMVQLKYLPEWIKGRRAAAENYNKLFLESGLTDEHIILPIEEDEVKHVYHLYVIRVLNNKREELKKYLGDHGIATGVHYPMPLHEQPCIIDFMKTNYNEMIDSGQYPETNRAVKEILSLPMYPNLSVEHITEVVDTIKKFFQEGA
ncbi:DegT/DnrJ/EryC1/StrS family aminotransferase [[Eubacterium] cellulosolvens]